jgi:xanthine dehydrogenase small subunit
MPLEDYFIAYGKQDRHPGEFVESVSVPVPAKGAFFAVHKITKRRDEDITAALGAFHVVVKGGVVASARIAYGGMAATPKRAVHAEDAVTGQPWDEATVERAIAALAQDFAPISDWRASADYRARIAGNLLRRLFVETTDEATETRLVGDRSLAHV